ncbi:glucose-6-phosphate isomerase [Sunxiuqinia elliptica]|uniref:Glucose-6-phosphate isomerase n=1 Tax=Sunxiuqinia elliptica TaxID=655355 RepID=A0A4R6H8D8_9BACT|nr:glucose-6-phosphate isomerase [Sunxiuqinia elliptica]TDO04673.1 glucose-6-phosphate isomerase [Sunxiuqinia elliptica]TDO64221.1 glucose-6-phosphate isomerase [Sunxiuqinia elliptica]
MKSISLNLDKTFDFISKDTVESYAGQLQKHNEDLHNKTGKGNDFLGWVNLPTSISEAELADYEATAKTLQDKKIEVFVVVGIGGSYLGAKAVVDALTDSFAQLKGSDKPLILFAGQNIGEDYLYELRQLLKTKEYALAVISKSGTTTEPAIAFRLLKQDIEEKYGKEEAVSRIIAVTDAERGALKSLANSEGYKTYVIPDDVGGRYSVLTPVGLLAIAVAGFDIRALVQGAVDMENASGPDVTFENNLPAQYAAVRNELYKSGKMIEILVNYNPKLHYFAEWWKQLYGESEGKEGKGIFPASVDFTSDLHSMGQYIQEGERKLFETVLSVASPDREVRIPSDEANLDSLNYLADKRVDEVNKMAELGTMLAHVDGGVPNIQVELPKLNEYYLGQLIYFFEKACGLSGYTLGVNPFDQPGVEAYKKNMFALLEKPGFEEATKAIKARL